MFRECYRTATVRESVPAPIISRAVPGTQYARTAARGKRFFAIAPCLEIGDEKSKLPRLARDKTMRGEGPIDIHPQDR
jgi:hypothetical protein